MTESKQGKAPNKAKRTYNSGRHGIARVHGSNYTRFIRFIPSDEEERILAGTTKLRKSTIRQKSLEQMMEIQF